MFVVRSVQQLHNNSLNETSDNRECQIRHGLYLEQTVFKSSVYLNVIIGLIGFK